MRKLLKSSVKWIKLHKKPIALSAANAIIILLLCYVTDNLAFSLNSDTTTRQWIERFKSYIGIDNTSMPNDLLVIDVAYDRQLIPVYDEYGFPMGNTDITDREKLFKFLNAAKRANNYRYIILDINFSDEFATDVDSSLFATITSMERIVIPKHSNTALADSLLYQKARFSEYTSTILDEGFAKYNYYHNNEYSIPLSIYNELTGTPFNKTGFIYHSEGHLCRRCISPQFKVKAWNEYDEEGNKNVLHLGCDITDIDSMICVSDYINGKFIVIGDIFERDMHDTYIGPVSGAIININAMYALFDKAHIINWSSIILLFLLYSAISAIMTFNIPVMQYIPLINRIKSRTIIFFLSFIGFSFILTIFALISHLVLNAEFNVFIPSLYFSIFNFIDNYRNIIKSV